jgi:hypothetical protein
MAYSGKFKPRNPQKYRGDPTQIFYRSLWELKLLKILDENPDIVQYASEEFCVSYLNPFDQKYHRYFPDFWTKNKNGDIMVLEVKPYKQTIPPKEPKNKKTKTYNADMVRYIINKQKWAAAEKYCKKQLKPWKFIILTENELDIKF